MLADSTPEAKAPIDAIGRRCCLFRPLGSRNAPSKLGLPLRFE